MKTVSATLLAAQQNTLAIPYIKCSINGTNYWSRLLYVEHTEQPMLGYATIVLENHDRALDSVDMTGYEVVMAYGHNTGIAVAEPDGDNDVNEYSHTPNIWVKEQSISSVEGESYCELYCEDMWAKLRETKVVAYSESSIGNIKNAGEFTVTVPYARFDNLTIWELMELVIHDVMGWTFNTLAVTGTTSDGIIDVVKPTFTVNNTQPETAASMLYRLIGMTKSYLRCRYDKTWDIIYPQTADVANRTFYSNQIPYFNEYREKVKVLIPNSIAVFCNNPEELDPWPTDVIVGLASDIHAVYGEVLDIAYYPGVTNQADATNVANAVLTKILAEKDAGRLLITQDAGIELYDRLDIYDNRGY